MDNTTKIFEEGDYNTCENLLANIIKFDLKKKYKKLIFSALAKIACEYDFQDIEDLIYGDWDEALTYYQCNGIWDALDLDYLFLGYCAGGSKKGYEYYKSNDFFKYTNNNMIESAILESCINGNLELIQLLMEIINKRHKKCGDECGYNRRWFWDSALYGACFGAHMNVVNYIMEKINRSKNGKQKLDLDYALLGACKGGDLEVINYIINLIGNKWSNDTWGEALMGAFYNGSEEIINFIKLNISKKQCDIDWNFPLQGAILGGHINLVREAIENKASFWLTGIMQSCMSGNIDIFNLMLEKIMFRKNNPNFLHYLKIACKNGHFKLVKIITAWIEIEKHENKKNYTKN